MRQRVVATVHLVVLLVVMGLRGYSNAAPLGANGLDTKASLKVSTLRVKREINSNDQTNDGRVISGSVPIWMRSAADVSNAGPIATAPRETLNMKCGEIYAASIMTLGCDKSLAIKLGNDCYITSTFHERICPTIRPDKVTIRHNMTVIANQCLQTLDLEVLMDEEFIGGRDNMSVSFMNYVKSETHNISGYLYFDSQDNQRVISGSVPIWMGSAADVSNAGPIATAPHETLSMKCGEIYAASIMTLGCDKSLAIKLGNDCYITSTFHERVCPTIRPDKVTIRHNMTDIANQCLQTLYLEVLMDKEFIGGRDKMSVSFINYVRGGPHNISGYLNFDPQPTVNYNSTISTTTDSTPCNCPTTDSCDPSNVSFLMIVFMLVIVFLFPV